MQALVLMSEILRAPDLLCPSPPGAPPPSRAFAPAAPSFLVQLTHPLWEADMRPLPPQTGRMGLCSPEP